MAAPQAVETAAAGGDHDQAPRGAESTWSFMLRVGAQLAMFLVVQSLLFGGRPRQTGHVSNSTNGTFVYTNTLELGHHVRVGVFVSEEMDINQAIRGLEPIWTLRNVTYGSWEDVHSTHVVIPASARVQHNGTLFLHAVLQREHDDDVFIKWDDPSLAVANMTSPLVHHVALQSQPKVRNLLSSSADAQEHEEQHHVVAAAQAPIIIGHWHENVTIDLVTDASMVAPGGLPPHVQPHYRFDADSKTYVPPFQVNTFWILQSNMYPINATLAALPLYLTFEPLSPFRFALELQMDASWKMQAQWGSAPKGEVDAVKRMLVETNPFFLGLTFVVSLLHTVFDCLAFKNDIQFWREQKSMQGLSLKAILISLAFQMIIFLYLLDNVRNLPPSYIAG